MFERHSCRLRRYPSGDSGWQTTDPGALDMVMQQNLEFFEQVLRPCLEANGVVIPDEVIPGTDEFGDLSQQFEALDRAGKCAEL